ncbi:MAG: thioesterase family protein [Candidatus Pelagadaptatus aseana]|uniref:acyl-CoA thioesterase n=1 Tax=Candidatus Pelagadaptatus aseana TaxID=3120508 RepID=UPI0039B2F75A
MERNDITFFYGLRVRYSEVDSQGIVFNAHYLTYFDTALTEYMRALGYDYHALVKDRGLDFHLVKSTVEYLAPIGFDDEIEIGVCPARIGSSSLTWTLAIFSKGQSECLSLGEIIWVCSKIGEHKSHPLPEDLLAHISDYEKS